MNAELILKGIEFGAALVAMARRRIAAGNPPTYANGTPLTLADVEAAGARLRQDAADGIAEAEDSLKSRQPGGGS
jgi:hypothetical protein